MPTCGATFLCLPLAVRVQLDFKPVRSTTLPSGTLESHRRLGIASELLEQVRLVLQNPTSLSLFFSAHFPLILDPLAFSVGRLS